MTDRTQLTRTCSACGIEKPLAAFLELSAQGTRYGFICAACRSTGITQKNPATKEDSHTTVTTGKRIGAKELVYAELEQRRQQEADKAARIEQLNKRDQLNTEKKEKTEEKHKAEEDHRRTYIDAIKPPGFMNTKRATETANRSDATQTQVIEKNTANKAVIDNTQNKKINAQQETNKRGYDFTGQFNAPKAGESWAHSATFLEFRERLTGGAPIKTLSAREQQVLTQAKAKTKTTEKKDALLQFAEEHWSGPKPTRRR